MERLLKDAQELTGVEYDIDNLGDVYDAIHVIQGDLGLTGVAAQEASTTFTGSFEAMKASAANLGAALATGGDIGPAMKSLATNAGNFLFKNLVPMIARIVKQLPTLIIDGIRTAGPVLMASGTELIDSLMTGMNVSLPNILNQAQTLITGFADKLIASIPTLIDRGGELILGLQTGIYNAIPQILSTAGKIITSIANSLSKNLPAIGDKGAQIAEKLATNFAKNLPKILMAVAKLGVQMVKALIRIVPKMNAATLKIVRGIVKGLGSGALSLIRAAMRKIQEAMRKPIEQARSKIQGITNKIKGLFPLRIGNVFSGLKLPHFSVSGGSAPFGIGGKGSLPKWSVSWYAKGGVFDGATLAGIGEKGREAAIPLEGRYMRPFAATIADEMGGIGETINFYITVEGTENPEAFADRLVQQLKLRTRMA